MTIRKLEERIRELEVQNQSLNEKLKEALSGRSEKEKQEISMAEHSLVKGKKAVMELTETKKQLEEIMRVKEQFLLNMSHEIRTPMNAIIGFTGLLMKTNPIPEQKEYIDAIRTSGENLLVIINDILDFSKIQAGKVQFENIGFSLSQVIPSVIELMKPKFAEKDISLLYTIDKEIPMRLTGDPTRLNQILLNLVGNAIKFTEKGEVRLDVKKLHENAGSVKLEFSISDTGIGIPESSMISIFEEFKQATGNITRKYGGTGLGLAIVKQLVEAQGGNISVKSKVGKGSVFSFTLVYGKEEAPATDAVRGRIIESEAAIVVEGLNVLLVEDNPLNQKLTMKILGDWKWNVDLAENGTKAIRKIRKNQYDIILMDVQLPEMNGYEATGIIRTKLPASKARIPVIALTAHAMAAEEKKCYQAGMSGYISKPFNPKKLYTMVLSILKKTGEVPNSSVDGMFGGSSNFKGKDGRIK
jgi:signal transduction histidine kinase/ActR/RegA family two-component response regulator